MFLSAPPSVPTSPPLAFCLHLCSEGHLGSARQGKGRRARRALGWQGVEVGGCSHSSPGAVWPVPPQAHALHCPSPLWHRTEQILAFHCAKGAAFKRNISPNLPPPLPAFLFKQINSYLNISSRVLIAWNMKLIISDSWIHRKQKRCGHSKNLQPRCQRWAVSEAPHRSRNVQFYYRNYYLYHC